MNTIVVKIESIFTITGSGIVLCGVVLCTHVSKKQTIYICNEENECILETHILRLEKFREILEIAKKNDNVGITIPFTKVVIKEGFTIRINGTDLE